MGATLGNFCGACASHGCNPEQFLGAGASHGCHSGQFFVKLELDMGATLSNFCGASHGCHPGQFLCTYC